MNQFLRTEKNNPVLLYLHGGPGSATSLFDYAFTRKWRDVYTVVTWDQCGCGKSFDKSHPETITADMTIRCLITTLTATWTIRPTLNWPANISQR